MSYSSGDNNSAIVLFVVNGNVSVPNVTFTEWLPFTKILVDGGDFQGFLKCDGSFKISLPAGSYVIVVANPTYKFNAQLVEVSTEGKIRAQSINYLQPDNVTEVGYPLMFESVGRKRYFHEREEFTVIDILRSRMVLMMFLPMVILFTALKFLDLDDPEVKQDLNSLNLKERLPELSELIVKLTGKKPLDAKQRTKEITKSQGEVLLGDENATT
ncbi:putative ER membrane protein complex subunit 7 [Apostichopus japonicus]|nr:putative ER membrane protein complex subunit 7 [Apostichopus japonicus]